jgi:hypothetical protein
MKLPFFFFGSTVGFELKAYTLSHSTSPLFVYFQDRVSQTICPGWLSKHEALSSKIKKKKKKERNLRDI